MFNIIEKLKNTSSLNEKKEILKRSNSDLFKKILKYTYDPLIVWEIKKIPEVSKTGTKSLEWAVDNLYQKLIHERIRGNEMREFVKNILENVSESDQKLITLMLKKDLKCGVNTKLINSVFNDLIFEAEYMGAVKFDEKKLNKLIQEGIIFIQEKLDGEYSNLFWDQNQITFSSRKGKKQYMPEEIVEKLKNEFSSKIDRKSFILNGELIILGFDRYTSNGLLTRIFKYEEKKALGETEKKLSKMLSEIENISNLKYSELISKIRYVIWDYINKEKKYFKRFEFVLELGSKIDHFIKIVPQSLLITKDKIKDFETEIGSKIDHFIVQDTIENKTKHELIVSEIDHFQDKIFEKFNEVISDNKEGLIVKSVYGKWKNGKPNYQIKIKNQDDCDLRIVDFEPGTPGTKYENTLGVLICESEDKKLRVRVGGINEYWRDQIWNQKEYYKGKIAKVEHNGLSKAKDSETYSLLHPRFICVRDDKDTADIIEKI